MNLMEIIKLILRNIKFLIVIPLILGITVFLLTQNSPKKYVSSAKIYTGIASGYSLESHGDSQYNYSAINNAFDNLIGFIQSRSTLEETALRLFALYLVQTQPDPFIITPASLMEIRRITPPEVKALADTNSIENTYRKLLAHKNQSQDNFLNELIEYTHPHFSYKAISDFKVRRIANSDMIEITFQSDDPAVCFQTLNILIGVFKANYTALKENQTDAVVRYFEKQLLKANEKLNEAEKQLLSFNMNNRIINYYEQTKHIASEKEKFDIQKLKVLLEFDASKAVMIRLEKQLNTFSKIELHNKKIVTLRKQLHQTNRKISLYNLVYPQDSLNNPQYTKLITEAKETESQLYNTLDSLHFSQNSQSGIQVKDIVNQWLAGVIAFETARAQMETLLQQQKEIDANIKQYAPLGANMKKIERSIDVREQEYLSLLHHLGLSKLKQQNIEMSTNLKTVDPPILPITPLPSKRKILILASLFAGFFMTLGFIILAYFLDSTLRDIDRAQSMTQLEAIGAFPLLKNANPKHPSNDDITHAALCSLINNLNKFKTNDLFRVLFVSNYSQEGKSTLLEQLSEKMKSQDINCSILKHPIQTEEKPFDSGYVFAENRAFTGRVLLQDQLNQYDLICYVIRADRGWTQSDQNIVGIVNSLTQKKIAFILNLVFEHNMNDVREQVYNKRSKLRRMIKRFLTFRFYETFDINRNTNLHGDAQTNQ
ncbi:MAG: GumC family protein [Marinifilaceae bacterium]